MARPVLKTPLCELLGIEYPILLAGRGGGDGFARAELAAAVSEAGGLGIIGAAGWTPEQIHVVVNWREELKQRVPTR